MRSIQAETEKLTDLAGHIEQANYQINSLRERFESEQALLVHQRVDDIKKKELELDLFQERLIAREEALATKTDRVTELRKHYEAKISEQFKKKESDDLEISAQRIELADALSQLENAKRTFKSVIDNEKSKLRIEQENFKAASRKHLGEIEQVRLDLCSKHLN